MIHLYKITQTLKSGKTMETYQLFDSTHKYRSLTFSDLKDLQDPEFSNLYEDDTNTWESLSLDSYTVEELAEVPHIYEALMENYPELLI